MSNNIIEFELNLLPPSINNVYKRSKNGGIYCDKSVLEFKEAVKKELNSKKFIKINGPVSINIKFHIKKKNADIDNPLKILLDSLNKIVYNDDKQVHVLNVVKIVGDIEKAIVVVSEITNILEF
jgi:Holliday junction resolvase RusA-like endonuclease